jgi:hypothetical protein
MKNIFFLFLILSVTSCQPKELPTVLEQADGYALMKVSHQTTQTEFSAMAKKLAEQGIEIDFSKSEFFEDGKLRNLKLAVKTPDGNSGATTADQVTLQFEYFGFLYQKGGDVSFQIGNI